MGEKFHGLRQILTTRYSYVSILVSIGIQLTRLSNRVREIYTATIKVIREEVIVKLNNLNN